MLTTIKKLLSVLLSVTIMFGLLVPCMTVSALEPEAISAAAEEAAAAELDGVGAEPLAGIGAGYNCTLHSNYPDGTDSTVTKTGRKGNLGLSTCQNLFTYPGYYLTSWNTAADGSGTEYATNAYVEGTLTLYAQWTDGSTVTPPTENKPSSGPSRDRLNTAQFRFVHTGTTDPSIVPSNHSLKDATSYTIGEIEGNDWVGYTVPVTVTLAHGDAMEAKANTSAVKSWGAGESDYVYDFSAMGGNTFTFTAYYVNGKWSAYDTTAQTKFGIVSELKTKIWLTDKAAAPTEYTVTYTDGVEGEEIFADQVYTVKENDPTPAFEGGTPIRQGYTFLGWEPEVAATVTGNATYTAQWKKNPESVTLKVNIDCGCQRHDNGSYVCMTKVTVYAGGTELGSFTAGGGHKSQSFTVPYSAKVRLVAAPNTYNVKITTLFDGYFDGETLISAEKDYTIDSLTADTELTAKFSKAEEYLITFNGNGTNKLSGTISGNNESVDAYAPGTEVSLKTAMGGKRFTRDTSTDYTTAYRQTGWNTKADGTGTHYGMNDTILMPAENLTLYAEWEAYENDHWTFNTTEGGSLTWGTGTKSGSGDSLKAYVVGSAKSFGFGIYAPIKAVAQPGYHFVGWYRGDELLWTADGIYSRAEYRKVLDKWSSTNNVIEARFEANTYNVTFNSNGGDTVDPITVTFGQRYGNLPSAGYIDGLQNLGWYLVDAEGNVVGSQINKRTLVTETRDHELFQKREIKVPSVKIERSRSPYSYIDEPIVLTAKTTEYSDLNYSYQWYKDGVALTDDDLYEGTATSVLTLKHDYVSASGTYSVTVTVTKGDALANVITENESAVGTATDRKMIIRRTVDQLLYDANGGEGGPSNNYSFLEDGKYIARVQGTYPTREYYTFTGWNTEADGSGDSYKGGDRFPFGTPETNPNGGQRATLYAQWTANEYTVTVVPNNGEADLDVTLTCEDTVSTKLPILTRTGYTFADWTDEDGNAVDTDVLYTKDFPGTLVAQWTANTYTLTFDPNGGKADKETASVTYDAAIGALPTATREGYTFVAWTDKDGKEVTKDTVYTVAGDSTLTAQWKANTYTLTFDANGGKADKETASVTYDAAIGALPAATRKGYTFVAWTDKDGKEVTKDTVYTVAGDSTLTAQWKANTYTITLDPNDGSKKTSTITVTFDQPVGKLPTPKRDGYAFAGWYADNGKTLVTADTIYSLDGDITLYAGWSTGVKTGDSANLVLCAAAMLTAAAAAFILLRKKKAKQ